MAICCAAPVLLIAAVTLFGISLGALASSFLSLATLLACPVGMYLMMRMMTNDRNIGVQARKKDRGH
jgi:multisubunit Na+/H+ antiporter MnhG subunit